MSITIARTPECPLESEFARSSIMARVSATESGSPTPTACERTRFTCKLANLIAGNAHIAQLAHASGDGVGEFVAGDDLVDHGAGAGSQLARASGASNTARRFDCDFANRLQRQDRFR